jgi:hypothetical protein
MRAGRIAAQQATEKRTHNPPYCYGLAARAGGIYNALACSGGQCSLDHHGRWHWRLRGPDS